MPSCGERKGHSLQAIALVSETSLRLVDVQQLNWQNRAHFLGNAGAYRAAYPGGLRAITAMPEARWRAVNVAFDEGLPVVAGRDQDRAAVDDALEALGKIDDRKGWVVELRFLGGLSVEETAAVKKVSPETVIN